MDRLDSRLDTVWADSMCCGGWDDGAVVVAVVVDVVTIVVTIVVRTVDATATTDTAVTAIQSGAVLNNCCG